MRLVPAHAVDRESVYLPHHGVFKGIGRNAKLRVVFDASCKTTSGISLNDALMIGPTVQQDLISIITRFRTFAYVFTADIVKMYRQILIHESQLHLQRILWRENSNSPVGTYELLTVTYGTSSAPFLATRCLQHLAQKHALDYPAGAQCVLRDFYVDDLLAGANTLSEAERIRDEVIALLKRGQFELGKWSSNCQELLQGISDTTSAEVLLGDESSSKILGVAWDPSSDGFRFGYNCGAPTSSITKRTILSEIASLFDPLGLLGPLTVVAKMIMQDTWQSNVGWDESLPQDLHHRWLNVKQQLTRLCKLRVPRFVGFRADTHRSQVHGFCDASERAYGACVYIRTRDSDRYRVELLISKSRIAPIRAVSLPRLELNAALLLSHLIEKIRASIDLSKLEIILWTDSTITIQWISSPSRKWNAFVANRVGEIQRLTRRSSWRHVPSAHNPADILSRGVDLAGLMQSTIWWNGPAFLQLTEEHWPVKLCVDLSGELPEQKRVTAAVIAIQQSIVLNLLDKHATLDRALRIIAYCLRIARSRTIKYQTTFISHHEITAALRVAVRCVQRHAFSREHKQLTEGRSVDGGSRILSLTPFMDEHGIIRVGGRISNAALPYDARHPMLLPKSHRLTTLIIQREHVKNLHSGLQATMHAMRRRFWPLAARSAVRKTIYNCVTCFKCKPVVSQALMADLPAQRVTASRPFTHSGVDYAGPILLKEGKRRNAKLHKAYISVFVCFSTRAVHLEIVTDLTSEAFLGAFKRFISRRGKPACVYSDNGTTFVGARKQIKELYDLINDNNTQLAMRRFMRDNEINWHFIPPHAPHVGGLWEAAVKSAKFHINRIIGNANLTYEEMQTVLCEIEAVLNSRPLTPLSEDPNDLHCITPGHFLIGAALNSFPVADLTKENPSRLLRWQRVEQLRQHFWKRWSTEYLHTLIERQKWKASKGQQLKIGQLAMVQQPGLGPLQWLTGRVQQLHPGPDGIARTATLRTAKGQLTRPLTKLAILPIDEASAD
ncbi:uncharacterized protein LOC114934768 [Nylanderia fulva]|uniref:uncharacterized protein LOC114934768 n=1 Tax=Nylanderia fulva TaxID=613905 RepID=UPI0010FAD3D6|nr:uncharacterized protein LOC114934768 [Nylanderia fulva]